MILDDVMPAGENGAGDLAQRRRFVAGRAIGCPRWSLRPGRPRRGVHGAADGQAKRVDSILTGNGAGKSTTIRLLLKMRNPSSGCARILGLDGQRHGVEVRRRVAYVPGDVQLLDPGSSGLAYLRLQAAIRCSPPPPLARRLDLALEPRIRESSKGNRQKLALAVAFGAPVDLLILHEPSAGLDPL